MKIWISNFFGKVLKIVPFERVRPQISWLLPIITIITMAITANKHKNDTIKIYCFSKNTKLVKKH